ncbi:hypothetical protein D9M68_609310 [compost metagenome]
MAPAKPQPSMSMRPTLMPTSRDEAAFCAAARIARPSGVKRKKANSSSTTSSVTPMAPISCADIMALPNHAFDGNGLGNCLMV